MKDKGFNRFLIVWTGQLASGLGTGITAFAIGVFVFGQTESAESFAGVMFSLFVPSILLGPFGGVLADRFDRRFMIILGDVGSAAGVIFLLGSLLSGQLSLWRIYLGIAFGSSFTALQGPAYKASLTDLLEESMFARAGGFIQLASSTRHIFAPIAAGFLLTVWGLETVLVLDIATFVLAVTATLCIPGRDKKSERKEKHLLLSVIKAGRKSLAGNREVMDIVLKLSVVSFFAGCIQTLFAPMILSLTDMKTLGTIQSISALGLIVGGLLIAILGFHRDPRMSMQLGLGSGGIFMAAMGISSSLPVITIFFFLFYLSLPLINSSAEFMIRTGIPNHQQGRAWGFISLLTQIGYIAAYLSAGFLAHRVFNPLLFEHGALAGSIGRIIGTGSGRGIALILILCGLGLFIIGIKGVKKQCCFLELSEKI